MEPRTLCKILCIALLTSGLLQQQEKYVRSSNKILSQKNNLDIILNGINCTVVESIGEITKCELEKHNGETGVTYHGVSSS